MHITGLFTALLIGIVLGVVARLIVPGKQNIPWWLTIIIGIVAALIGWAIASAIGVGLLLTIVIELILAVIGVVLVAGIRGRSGSGGRRNVA